MLVGQRVWQLAFTPDQKTDHQHQRRFNDITFIDDLKLATDEPVQSVTVGQLPWGVVDIAELKTDISRPKGGNMEIIEQSRLCCIGFAAA